MHTLIERQSHAQNPPNHRVQLPTPFFSALLIQTYIFSDTQAHTKKKTSHTIPSPL